MYLYMYIYIDTYIDIFFWMWLKVRLQNAWFFRSERRQSKRIPFFGAMHMGHDSLDPWDNLRFGE